MIYAISPIAVRRTVPEGIVGAQEREIRAKGGSRNLPAGEPSKGTPAPGLASGVLKAALVSKRAIWISTVVAVLALACGLGLLFLNEDKQTSKGQSYSAATFVGSETCAGCHQAEAKLWNASQHKAAMQHATDKTVLGNFNDASFDHYRRAFPLLPQGRQVSRRDRRTGRQARRRSR